MSDPQEHLIQLAMTDDEIYEIAVPFLPKSKNVWERWPPHFRWGERTKWDRNLTRQLAEVDLRCDHPLQERPKLDPVPHPEGHCSAPIAQQVLVEVEIWHATRRRRDAQNYVHPLFWFLADALVRNGVIPDDTPRHLRVAENFGLRFMVDRRTHVPAKRRQRTLIRITTRIEE